MPTNLIEKNFITAIQRYLNGTQLLKAPEVNTLTKGLTQIVFEELQEADLDLSAWTRIDAAEKSAGAHLK
jgi:hypothetical protein